MMAWVSYGRSWGSFRQLTVDSGELTDKIKVEAEVETKQL